MKSIRLVVACSLFSFALPALATASVIVSTGSITSAAYNDSGASGNYTNASSIVPSPESSDVAIGSTLASTNYGGTNEASGGSASVLVDGQTASAPSNYGNASLNPSQPTSNSNAAFDLGNGNWYVEFALPASANGYDITSAEVITGHQDGRVNQGYDLLVSSDGLNFYSLSDGSSPSLGTGGSGFSDDPSDGDGGAAETTITPNTGSILATGVKYFEFVEQTGGQDVYREIALYGTPTAVPEPSSLLTLCMSCVLGAVFAFRRRQAS